MKGNSDITATAFSDAALICVYLCLSDDDAIQSRAKVPTGTVATVGTPRFLRFWLRKELFSRYIRNYAKQPQTLFLTFAVAEKMILAL